MAAQTNNPGTHVSLAEATTAPLPEATLKTFIAGNMPLLTTFTVLAGLAGFVLTLPLGWFAPLLRAGLLMMTVVVWVDLLDQLPVPLRLTHWQPYPAEYSWRFVWFAYLLQLLMVGFIAFVAVTFPRVAVPALAASAGIAVAARLAGQASGLVRVIAGLIAAEVTLILLYPTHQGVIGWLLDRLR